MKNLILLALAASILCTAAFAKPAPKPTYEQLRLDAENFVELFADHENICDIRLKDTKEGFTLSVKERTKPVIYIDVRPDSQVTVKNQDESDGSFSHDYKIKDEKASLEFFRLDDAYDRLDVNQGRASAECLLEY